MDDPQKMTYQFSDFFEKFSGSDIRNHRRMRAVIDFFEIYTMNTLVAKQKI